MDVILPANHTLSNLLLKQYPDSHRHVCISKTYELLSRLAHWKNMFKDVRNYTRQCIQCQRNKPPHQHPHGLLQPLEVPDSRWQSVAIDFITRLPKSNSLMPL